MELVVFQSETVRGKLIEILHFRVHPKRGAFKGLFFNQFFYHGDMAVIDMGVCDHMNQFPGLQAAYLCKHMKKHCVLADIPAVGSEHILRTLV